MWASDTRVPSRSLLPSPFGGEVLVGGGPGCCLVKVVLGNLVVVHYSSGWHTSHPCAISKINWWASASVS